MTREEEILEASKQHKYGTLSSIEKNIENIEAVEFDSNDLATIHGMSFYEGAKWADRNPQSPWISVKDDLPCNHKKLLEDSNCTKMVEVVFQDKGSGKRRVEVRQMLHHKIDYLYYDKWFWNAYWDEDIIYWRPIPEPPKE